MKIPNVLLDLMFGKVKSYIVNYTVQVGASTYCDAIHYVEARSKFEAHSIWLVETMEEDHLMDYNKRKKYNIMKDDISLTDLSSEI